MKNVLINLLVILMMLSCNDSKNIKNKKEQNVVKESAITSLNNTIWECVIDHDCKDQFRFREGNTFNCYNCETRDSSWGVYFLQNDTLILDEKRNILNDLTGEIDYVERSKYWAILKSNRFTFFKKSDWSDGVFQDSGFSFANGCTYELVKSISH